MNNEKIFTNLLALVCEVVLTFVALWLLDLDKTAISVAVPTVGVVSIATSIILFFATKKDDPDLVKSPMPIVYFSRRKGLYARPYIDLTRLDKIWGIAVGNVYLKKTNSGENSFGEAMEKLDYEMEKFSAKVLCDLPSKETLRMSRQFHRQFTATVQMLNSFGVKADEFIGDTYWCKSPDNCIPFVLSMDRSKLADGQWVKHPQAKSFQLRLTAR